MLGLAGLGAIAVGVSLWRVVRTTSEQIGAERAGASLRTPLGGTGLRFHVKIDPARMGLQSMDYQVDYLFESGNCPPQPPNSLLDRWAWAHSNGGLDVGRTRVSITIQATLSRAIVVGVPRLVSSRVDQQPGTVWSPSGLGGGGVEPRVYEFVLDRPDEAARYLEQGRVRRPQSFRMNKDDTERIDVICLSTAGWHEWSLVIPALVDGRERELIVDNAGKPFLTVGRNGYGSRFDEPVAPSIDFG